MPTLNRALRHIPDLRSQLPSAAGSFGLPAELFRSLQGASTPNAVYTNDRDPHSRTAFRAQPGGAARTGCPVGPPRFRTALRRLGCRMAMGRHSSAGAAAELDFCFPDFPKNTAPA